MNKLKTVKLNSPLLLGGIMAGGIMAGGNTTQDHIGLEIDLWTLTGLYDS